MSNLFYLTKFVLGAGLYNVKFLLKALLYKVCSISGHTIWVRNCRQRERTIRNRKLPWTAVNWRENLKLVEINACSYVISMLRYHFRFLYCARPYKSAVKADDAATHTDWGHRVIILYTRKSVLFFWPFLLSLENWKLSQ